MFGNDCEEMGFNKKALRIIVGCLRLNVYKLFVALPTSQQQSVFAANSPVRCHAHKRIM